ncbi:hypothetical protein DFJ74DRAFT_653346 [Hyaloraphidium curvatum]|nr:hypothetical protein DFJ74DRAFT_653346 [Hyaloraphidium curvatum]
MLEYLIPLLRGYSATVGVTTIIGLGTAALAARFLPDSWRIQAAKKAELVKELAAEGHPEAGKDFLVMEKREWRREVPYLLRNVIFQVALFSWFDSLRAKGIVRLAKGLVDNSVPKTVALVAGQFAAYFVVFDAYYYFLHRFFLHGRLGWWIHEIHHKSFVPNAFTGFTFHPIEAAITGGFVHLVAYLAKGRMHEATFAAVMLYGLLENLYVHLGFQVTPMWLQRSPLFSWYMTTAAHDLHHSRVRCAYGGFTVVWDRLFDTLGGDAMEQSLQRVEKQVEEAKRARESGLADQKSS